MPDSSKGNVVAISEGFIQRATGKLFDLVAGWFPPGAPPPQTSPTETPVRQWDFDTFLNTTWTPRNTEAITFPQLRLLADNNYLLRIAIETAKNRIARMPIHVRLAAKPGESQAKRLLRSQNDPRVQQITDLLKYPDGEQPWETWVRCLLEDMYVLDAVTIYPRKNYGGETVRLDLIDGATIKRVIDATGSTPLPPLVAYQQIIHGQVSAELSNQDILYAPRNRRTHKLYGYSHVEQVAFIVNMAIRRALMQMGFYTEGNIPEALLQVPDNWSREDIKRFQLELDIATSKLTRRKGRMLVIPGGGGGTGSLGTGKATITFTKTEALKDEMDEWLGRVICWVFGLTPSALMKSVNRASAEQMDESAEAEGLYPVMQYVENTINRVIQAPWFLNMPDVEIAFKDDAEEDRLKQAEIDDLDLRNGKKSIDEVREAAGLESIGADTPCIYSMDGSTLTPVLIAMETGETIAQVNAENALNPPEPVQDPNAPPPAKGKPNAPKATQQAGGRKSASRKAYSVRP